MTSIKTNLVEVELSTGEILRVQVLAPHTFRVRLGREGPLAEPALVRYGILCS